jgi:proteasome lid subunit RPN8/RPN11
MTGATNPGVTLVMTDEQFEQVRQAAENELETAAVLLGSVLETPDAAKFLVTDITWVPEASYQSRRYDGLSIASSGYVPALTAAANRGLTALWFHTHPGWDGWPVASIHDETVDAELAPVFRLRTDSDLYGHVVVSPRPDSLAFSGVLANSHEVRSIERLLVVGRRLVVMQAVTAAGAGGSHSAAEDLFSRNIAAFGGPVQAALAQLRVAIVGAGGTGSSVAEQLVRLGVRDLLMVDPDNLEASNVTRVYGSTPDTVGSPKVETLAAHLQRIAPDATILADSGSLNSLTVAQRVSGRDVIFGCTDDNSGRVVLARIAAYTRALVIDCGVVLSTDHEGRLRGIDGRITTMRPGAACLLCRGRIDLARAAAEQMSHEQHAQLAAEGYAPELPGVQPAVVSFTTMVAAQAVTELLEAMTGFGPPDQGTEVLLRVHDREISTNSAQPKHGHFCDPEIRVVEVVAQEPFLGKLWAS